jgi:hypothetical protein
MRPEGAGTPEGRRMARAVASGNAPPFEGLRHGAPSVEGLDVLNHRQGSADGSQWPRHAVAEITIWLDGDVILARAPDVTS